MIFLIFPELGIKRARLYQIWHPRFERQNQKRINNDTKTKFLHENSDLGVSTGGEFPESMIY